MDYSMVLQVIFYLTLIIGLFFVIIKFIAQKNKHFMAGRMIKTIGGVSLGQNKSLQVVKIGHHLYIVGVGDTVQFISQINDPEEVMYIQENIHASNTRDFPGIQSFTSWIKGFQKRKETEEDEIEEDLSTSFQQVFSEKMGRISNRTQKVNELFKEDKNTDRLNDKS